MTAVRIPDHGVAVDICLVYEFMSHSKAMVMSQKSVNLTIRFPGQA